MNVGDLVRFCPDSSIARASVNRPLGIVLNVETDDRTQDHSRVGLVSVYFPHMDAPYASVCTDFEVLSEAR